MPEMLSCSRMATPGLASRVASQSRAPTSPHKVLAQVGTLSALGTVAEEEKNHSWDCTDGDGVEGETAPS